jgi:hypothetical protein
MKIYIKIDEYKDLGLNLPSKSALKELVEKGAIIFIEDLETTRELSEEEIDQLLKLDD